MRWLIALTTIWLIGAGCSGPAPEKDIPLAGPDSGRKLYVAKCSRCHKFYDPAKYSDEEWQKWMRKMARKSRLNEAQAEAVAQYIDENLRHRDRKP